MHILTWYQQIHADPDTIPTDTCRYKHIPSQLSGPAVSTWSLPVWGDFELPGQWFSCQCISPSHHCFTWSWTLEVGVQVYPWLTWISYRSTARAAAGTRAAAVGALARARAPAGRHWSSRACTLAQWPWQQVLPLTQITRHHLPSSVNLDVGIWQYFWIRYLPIPTDLFCSICSKNTYIYWSDTYWIPTCRY
jgi:hypothetical protein